ncbi:uncharacterized protein LOC143859176 [Tasmannia lanceolata]|uniref:uncharacterized protein LOC143859176 n=1 Tax=Tasmannia lanceolata TaxID=3420 RepID=UPI0040636AB3
MDTQMKEGHFHNYEDFPQAMEGDAKKSVLKKVKDKAKKIKKMLGHEHGDSHSHEEDNEEEESEESPEVHGAPMYESAAVPNVAGGLEISGQSWGILGNSPPSGEDPGSPKDRPDPANYQTKVADPTLTGGNEAGVGPLLRTLGAMKVSDEPPPDSSSTKTNPFSENPLHVPSQQPNQQASNYSENISAGTSAITAVSAKNTVTENPYRADMGVSVKEFVAEKLRPGDEDRALSEVILEVIRKRREERPGNVSDRPAVVDSGNQSPGGGVVGMIRGAVSSLFGKGGESRASPGSDPYSREGEGEGAGNGNGNGNGNTEERRCQESAN